jgi:glycosyltransferase involved in cell wall biosynthesis
MKKKNSNKILIITSHLKGRAIAYEWICTKLTQSGFDVLLLHIDTNESNFEKYILKSGINYKRIHYSGKNKFSMVFTILKLVFQILKFRPSVLHTHYFDANLLGLTAAWICRVQKRIYTRHTTTQRYRYLKGTRNFEKYFNKISTQIISISDVVTGVLTKIEQVPISKIHKVHHGFDLEMFTGVEQIRIDEIRRKYSLTTTNIVVGSISRYDEWKGVEYTIDAFKEIVKEFPYAILVLANADGIRKEFIKEKLRELPERSYREIVYEDDVFALIQTFDCFVHVPIDEEIEAFGQVYIEVMASSIPMVCTLSGIAAEYIEDKKNAIVVNYKNSKEIKEGIEILIKNKDLKEVIVTYAKNSLNGKFDIDLMISKLKQIYIS